MYVWGFFLTKHFDEYEKNQINLVKNFDWFDIDKLDGFVDEVGEILSKNNLLSNEKIEKIVEQVKLRIEYVSNLKYKEEKKWK